MCRKIFKIVCQHFTHLMKLKTKSWLSVTVAFYPLKMALLLLVVVEVHLEDLRDHL